MIHEICYDRALSLSPSPGSDLIEAIVVYVPIFMDGVSWADDEGKTKINAGELMEDFIRLSRTTQDPSIKREILSNVESKQVRGFEAPAMSDGNYFPIPQVVGGFHYPVVFNNACSSWRSLSLNFGAGGASVYIGTATDVLNSVALTVAESFVKAVTSGKSIGVALFRAQKQFVAQFGYSPYLMHGYHFTGLKNPSSRLGRQRVIQELLAAIEAAKRNLDSKNMTAVVSVLQDELFSLLNIRSGSNR